MTGPPSGNPFGQNFGSGGLPPNGAASSGQGGMGPTSSGQGGGVTPNLQNGAPQETHGGAMDQEAQVPGAAPPPPAMEFLAEPPPQVTQPVTPLRSKFEKM